MAASRLVLRSLKAIVGLFLFAFYLVVAVAGVQLLTQLWAIRPPPTTIAGIVAGLLLLSGYLSYRFGTAQLLRNLDAVELPRARAPGLYRRLDRLCEQSGIEQPRVLVADLPTPNTFAVGGAREGILVFDRSLFRVLDGDELEGIMAHELAHLERYDALIQTLAFSAIRTVSGLLMLVFLPVILLVTGFARATAWLSGRPDSWHSTAFGRLRYRVEQRILMLFSVLTLVLLAGSRRREYAADERAASMTGNPLALARALRTIQRYSEPRRGLLSLLTIQTDDENQWTRLLSTHPPMDDRIARLVEQATERRSVTVD
jgi:heat shock protein HtpX